MGFFQRELIFLFIISISLHYLRTVSGFFSLNNDDSFNVFGLLKNNLDFFFHLQSLDIVIHNEIRHQSLHIYIADTVYCVFLHFPSALLQAVICD